MQPELCGWCRCALEKMQRCSHCHKQHYCGRECQRKHWAMHKTRCGKETAVNHCTLEDVNHTLDTLVASFGERFDENVRDDTVQVLGCVKPLVCDWSQFLAVRASPVHGVGVFATGHLPRGAVLTGYPCHLVAFDREVLRLLPDSIQLDASQDNITYWANHYSFQLDKRIKLIGLPSVHNNRNLLGHLINDASLVNVFAGIAVEQLADAQQLLACMTTYYQNVARFTNCVFRKSRHQLAVYIVAHRDIQPGEELLINYGMDYWQAVNYGAGIDERFPFILQNLLKLRDTNAEFRALSDRSLAIDRASLSMI